MRELKIYYYDSFLSVPTKQKSLRQQCVQNKKESSNVYTNALLRWIHDEYKQTQYMNPTETWEHKIYTVNEVPQQIRNNCGVHVLASIENLVRSDYDIEYARNFNKDDIPFFRKKCSQYFQ